MALAAMLAALVAAPASASITTGSAKVRTKDIAVGAFQPGGGRVDCPSGYKATAGGGTWTATGQSGVALVLGRWLSVSLPVNKGASWYVAGYNGDGADAVLHLRVMCLPSSVVGTLTFKEAWSVWNGVDAASATVSCGPGKVLVTGGAAWQVQGNKPGTGLAQHHWLASSSPRINGKAWFAAGSGNVPGAGEQLHVVAYCRSSSAVGAYTIRFKEISPVGTNIAFVSFFSDGAKICPSGRVVTGGAYWQNPFAVGGKAPVTDGFLGRSTFLGKDRWSATGTPGNGAIDRQLVVVVMCRP
jgi:hypothetical protein